MALVCSPMRDVMPLLTIPSRPTVSVIERLAGDKKKLKVFSLMRQHSKLVAQKMGQIAEIGGHSLHSNLLNIKRELSEDGVV